MEDTEEIKDVSRKPSTVLKSDSKHEESKKTVNKEESDKESGSQKKEKSSQKESKKAEKSSQHESEVIVLLNITVLTTFEERK